MVHCSNIQWDLFNYGLHGRVTSPEGLPKPLLPKPLHYLHSFTLIKLSTIREMKAQICYRQNRFFKSKTVGYEMERFASERGQFFCLFIFLGGGLTRLFRPCFDSLCYVNVNVEATCSRWVTSARWFYLSIHPTVCLTDRQMSVIFHTKNMICFFDYLPFLSWNSLNKRKPMIAQICFD